MITPTRVDRYYDVTGDVIARARACGLVTRTITACPGGGQDYRYRLTTHPTAGQP